MAYVLGKDPFAGKWGLRVAAKVLRPGKIGPSAVAGCGVAVDPAGMRWLYGALAATLLLIGCSGRDEESTPTVEPSATATASATSVPSPTPTTPSFDTPTATATPTEVPTPEPALEPVGFPLGLDVRTGLVVGEVGSRTIEWSAGPSAREVTELLHHSDDPVESNSAGWNCRVHVEYEAQPAVDWYIEEGTPLYATMDGTATLYMNTVVNAFDYWAVDREPYIGNPDRANAPVSPFPGPGGGMGVFVRIENDGFRVDYGHLEIGRTAQFVPMNAWLDGFSPDTDWAGLYSVPQSFQVAGAIARWEVRAGDLVGYSGDAGYSEAPHLHYAITEKATGARLCPTSEPGFQNAGWLWR